MRGQRGVPHPFAFCAKEPALSGIEGVRTTDAESSAVIWLRMNRNKATRSSVPEQGKSAYNPPRALTQKADFS
jgi:hypothetical protein